MRLEIELSEKEKATLLDSLTTAATNYRYATLDGDKEHALFIEQLFVRVLEALSEGQDSGS